MTLFWFGIVYVNRNDRLCELFKFGVLLILDNRVGPQNVELKGFYWLTYYITYVYCSPIYSKWRRLNSPQFSALVPPLVLCDLYGQQLAILVHIYPGFPIFKQDPLYSLLFCLTRSPGRLLCHVVHRNAVTAYTSWTTPSSPAWTNNVLPQLGYWRRQSRVCQ